MYVAVCSDDGAQMGPCAERRLRALMLRGCGYASAGASAGAASSAGWPSPFLSMMACSA